MDKVSIKAKLKANTQAILTLLHGISDEDLNHKPTEKWSVAENSIHLVKSVSPINVALNLPKITFLIFGKASSSLSYDEVIATYTSKLNDGAKASKPYMPREGKNAVKASLAKRFEESYDTLGRKLDNWSEEDLDQYRLPHPILGKLTIREMLYFTIYHMEHHLQVMANIAKS